MYIEAVPLDFNANKSTELGPNRWRVCAHCKNIVNSHSDPASVFARKLRRGRPRHPGDDDNHTHTRAELEEWVGNVYTADPPIEPGAPTTNRVALLGNLVIRDDVNEIFFDHFTV